MADRTILVIVDPTRSEQFAVERAAGLAGKLSARLELFICHYDVDIAAGRFSTIWIKKSAKEELIRLLELKLEELAAPIRKRGLEVATDVVWDRPLDEGIVRKVLASRPWIVVKDTHHHNIWKRTILSNTDWSLIRSCPTPLLLVKLHPSSSLRKICAAIDPTHEHDKPAELDSAILELAKTLADATGADLHAIHTYAVGAEPVGLEAPPVGRLTEAVRQEHETVLREFLQAHPVPADNVHLLEGPAYERLVEFASRQGIDVMVMGAVSRGALDRIFVGSTAERVLDRLPCDLLIVKPETVVAALTRR